MKTILIIGMGRFGHHLAEELSALGNQVMIVDTDEELMKDLLPYVTNAQIADCTDPRVLEQLGLDTFDLCFVCVGDDFQNSLEITSLLKEMGAKHVISKAGDATHAKFLLRNGADEVVYPERDMALRLAARHTANNALDYVGLGGDVSMYEVPVQPQWAGKTVRELDFRARYQVTILATKREGNVEFLMNADHVFTEEETLLVVGHKSQLTKFLKKID